VGVTQLVRPTRHHHVNIHILLLLLFVVLVVLVLLFFIFVFRILLLILPPRNDPRDPPRECAATEGPRASPLIAPPTHENLLHPTATAVWSPPT
jgi:hypothetical protein